MTTDKTSAAVAALAMLYREAEACDLSPASAAMQAARAVLVQQAPAAPAEAIASLRHLYENMLNGAVRDTASAKRIATGLLGPAIEKLERAAPIEPAKTEAPARIVDHIPADAATLLKELKNIAHDEDQPLGNRLQMISARISNFWDALSTPPTPEAEPVQQDTKGGAA
jgi:hypothetical protein